MEYGIQPDHHQVVSPLDDTARQYCTFHLGELFLGLPVEDVQEVIRFQPMTRVPLADDVVKGLINLRGQIVMAVDLRRRFQLDPSSSDEPPMNVVVRDSDGGAVAFLVDAIGDVLEIDGGIVEPPPPTLQGVLREMVRGVCKLEEGLLLLMNLDRAVPQSRGR